MKATTTLLKDNLKLHRKERGLSQADVADYLGVSAATYSAYETGSLLSAKDTAKGDKISSLMCNLTDEELDNAVEYISFLLWQRGGKLWKAL